MPFASINSTNLDLRTNPWNFHEKLWEFAELENEVFLSEPFWNFVWLKATLGSQVNCWNAIHFNIKFVISVGYKRKLSTDFFLLCTIFYWKCNYHSLCASRFRDKTDRTSDTNLRASNTGNRLSNAVSVGSLNHDLMGIALSEKKVK